MDKIEFINTVCRPNIKVMFNEPFFLMDDETSVSYKKFSSVLIGEWQVPWYTVGNGNGSEYNTIGSIPIKIKETLERLDPTYESHSEHIERIKYFKDKIGNEKLFVYAPVLPVVGYDGDKTYIVFDGNHRLSAFYSMKCPEEVLVLLVQSKNIKNINLDFHYHS